MLSQLKENKYNMNFLWKFKKAAAPFPLQAAANSIICKGKQFFEPDYDDSDWENVSVPHAPNSADSFDNPIRDAGEERLYRGFMFYRKSFVLENVSTNKFFLEFEAVRQSVYLYVNGSLVGYYEAGTAPIGFDITPFVIGGTNLIAVATDNAAYRECEFVTVETVPGNTPGDLSGARHQWNQKDFNEVQGGITGNVNLYITKPLYLTRPLYNNLKTTGTYIYPSDFDFENRSATINVRAEIRNELSSAASVSLHVYIYDEDGLACDFASPCRLIAPAKDKGVIHKTVVATDAYSENPTPTNANTVDVSYITLSAKAESLTFWSVDNPHLYDVYIALVLGGEIVNTQKITTGFRKVTYSIEKGLCINGESIFLTGYAQRSTNEWAVIGIANDWLTDFDMELVRKSGANYLRWMHVTPKPVAIRSGDKYGVISVCPAGDKESDQEGRYWNMRVEAMRDAIIYFRNSPSVIFYEAGNAAITGEHMREMTKIKNVLDPSGYRFMGCRSLTTEEQIMNAEWVGTMVYRYDAHAKSTMDKLNYYIPMLETEYKRDESPRRVWDDYSPPHFDYVNKWLGEGAKKTDGYDVWDETQEDFAVLSASEKDGYAYFYQNRVGGITGKDYYSGSAIMVWSDSNMHGRNSGSENCRTTGKVDPVRIPKPAFYALRAMQANSPKVYIVGHWNYPPDTPESYNYFEKEWNGTYWQPTDRILRRDPTDKTVYVIGSLSCERVELYVNGALKGSCSTPADDYVYPFPHIDVTQHGKIEAIAYNSLGERVASHAITTAGEKKRISLTLTTGPDGLRADGSDICFFDVAVTDENGSTCPLAFDKIDFNLKGDGVFLGGYNSGTFNETSVIHKSYCYAECGTNRVFVRSKLFGKSFSLTASCPELQSAEITVSLTPFELKNSMTELSQQAQGKNTFTYTDKYIPHQKRDDSNRASSHTKDIYSVIVNGKALSFTSAPYRPDSFTGVLCPVRGVLDALGVEYTYSALGKVSLHIPSSGITLTEGETTIHIGNETNLTNAEFYVEHGEIIAEISAVLAYIDKVQAITDASEKTLTITAFN